MTALEIAKSRLGLQVPYTRPLLAARFCPTGRWAYTSSEDNTLQRWNLAEEKPQPLVMQGHESWVHALCGTPQGQYFLSGGCDGRLIWWASAEDKCTLHRQVDAHQGWVRAIALSPDGKELATCGNDKSIALWELESGQLIHRWQAHPRDVYSVVYHPSGTQILSGDLLGNVIVWDRTTRMQVKAIDAKALHSFNGGQLVDFGGVRALAVSSDGKTLVAGGLHKSSNPLGAVHEPLCLRIDLESGQVTKSHVAEGVTGGVLWGLRFLADGTVMGVSGGSSGGMLLFWNAEKETAIHRFNLPNIARDLDLHQDGFRVCTSHHDHHLRITHLSA
jgi:WD40 repeat protein